MKKFKKILKSIKRKLRLFYWEITLGDLLTPEQILQIVDGEDNKELQSDPITIIGEEIKEQTTKEEKENNE